MDGLLLNIFLIEEIATFRAELGRVCRISRLPAALIALVLRNTGGFLSAALGAEFAFVDSAAGGAGPAVGLGFGFLGAAFGAELAGGGGATGAFPAVRRLRLRLLCAAVRTEFALVNRSAGAGPALCIGRLR